MSIEDKYTNAEPGEPGFNGEYHEYSTGWQILGNGYRVYNPVLMRFHSPDSLSPFDKGGLNAYMYCGGDPVNKRDPTGHLTVAQLVMKRWVRFYYPDRTWYRKRFIQKFLLFESLAKQYSVAALLKQTSGLDIPKGAKNGLRIKTNTASRSARLFAGAKQEKALRVAAQTKAGQADTSVRRIYPIAEVAEEIEQGTFDRIGQTGRRLRR